MSPSPASLECRTARNCCAHLFSPRAPSPAACTQTGSPDRNTCTACTNAIQTRTSDTAPQFQIPAAPRRTVRTATPPASPADSPASAPARGPTSADRSCAPPALSAAAHFDSLPAAHDPDLDTHAAYISPRLLPTTRPVLSTRSLPCASTRPVERRRVPHSKVAQFATLEWGF